MAHSGMGRLRFGQTKPVVGLPSMLEAEKGRSSFLKKRSKRLLSLWVSAIRATYAKEQQFFGSFFQKRTPS
jgi:hypothetical protein